VAVEIINTCLGLYTNGNRQKPMPGALVKADELMLRYPDRIETRDGIRDVPALPWSTATHGVDQIMPYRTKLVLNGAGGQLSIDNLDDTFTALASSGEDTPAGAQKMHSAEAKQNLYYTEAGGVRKLEDFTSAPIDVGVPKAYHLELSLATGSANNWFASADPDWQVAYRLVWGIRDANDNVLLGAPSGRYTITNTDTAARQVDIYTLVPDDVTENHFFQLYRTAQFQSTPGEEYALVLESSFLEAELDAFRGFTVTDTVPDALRGVPLYTNPSQEGILQANEQPPFSLDLAWFNGMMFYANARERHRYFLTVIAISDGDYEQGLFAGEIDGQVTGGSPTIINIPDADVTRLHVGQRVEDPRVPADTNIISVDVSANTATMSANATSSDPGVGILEIKERLVVDGTELLGVEELDHDPASGLWGINTSEASPALQSAATARNIVEAMNFGVDDVFASLVGDNDSIGSEMVFERRDLDDGVFTVIASNGEAYYPNPQTPGADVSKANLAPSRIYFSKLQEPEAVPLTNYVDVGAPNHPILRIAATQETLFVFKSDGVFRINGYNPFSILVSPHASQVVLLSPETIGVLDNKILFLATDGVYALHEGGVSLLSMPVSDILTWYTTSSSSEPNTHFACVDTRHKLYVLFLWEGIGYVGEQRTTRALVFHGSTGLWSQWNFQNMKSGAMIPQRSAVGASLALGHDHARVGYLSDLGFSDTDPATQKSDTFAYNVTSKADDVLTINDGNPLLDGIEAGDLLTQGADTDLVVSVTATTITLEDASDIETGQVSVRTSIKTKCQWAPINLGLPYIGKHFQEIGLSMLPMVSSTVNLVFSGDLNSSEESVEVSTTQPSPDLSQPGMVRAHVPQSFQRGSELNVRVESVGRSNHTIDALIVKYEVASERSRRT
jgi:hypothetical protein